MVCDAVEEFPHPSVAVHVLFTLYDPVHIPGVVASAKLNEIELPHASVAVACVKDGVAGQNSVDGAGSAAMTGAVISCTLTVCDAVEKLPHASVAVHVLVTLYDPAHVPLVVTSEGTSVNELPHASVAVACAKTGTAGQVIVVGAGSDAMTGAVISWTFIVCDAVDELPHASVAVHVRFTLYEPAHVPVVVTFAKVNVIALPHTSVAVACVNEGVAGQLIVVGEGRGSMTGAVISCTMIVCVAVDVLPHPSVAVHFLFTVYDPAQAPGVVISIEDNVMGLLPHPSVAVA